MRIKIERKYLGFFVVSAAAGGVLLVFVMFCLGAYKVIGWTNGDWITLSSLSCPLLLLHSYSPSFSMPTWSTFLTQNKNQLQMVLAFVALPVEDLWELVPWRSFSSPRKCNVLLQTLVRG